MTADLESNGGDPIRGAIGSGPAARESPGAAAPLMAAGDGCGWEPRPHGLVPGRLSPFFFFSFYLLLQIFSKENFEHKQ